MLLPTIFSTILLMSAGALVHGSHADIAEFKSTDIKCTNSHARVGGKELQDVDCTKFSVKNKTSNIGNGYLIHVKSW